MNYQKIIKLKPLLERQFIEYTLLGFGTLCCDLGVMSNIIGKCRRITGIVGA
jgi:hypothetical protein